jgi:hypothetical protein
MPRTKVGGLTGASLESSKKRTRGGLTGSKHFETPSSPPSNQEQAGVTPTPTSVKERIQQQFGNGVQAATTAVSTVRQGGQAVSSAAKQVRRAASGGSELVTKEASGVLEGATSYAGEYGVALIDLKSEMGADPYKASDSLPQMDAKEANQQKLIIQKQNNALEVRLERTKQKRQVAKIYNEELKLVGDLADIRATGFDVASKFVKSEIANVDFQTQQSRLEEHEELLHQQIIRTQGVMNLTAGIQTEWDLKLEKQQTQNERLEIEIQGGKDENSRRREALEAFVFAQS